jgi:predicted TIM-barrel fold metal-dependent hydrolase
VLLTQCAMSQVVSLVFHGVFEKYPELRVAVIEASVTWLPSLLCRMDTDWKALRSDVPWVKRRPSEVVREHLPFTT